MNTFLPYPDFQQSAQVLDNKRLSKQRVECLQILKALSDPTYGWQNHPAVRMWRYWNISLATYGNFVCLEWIKRGFKDSLLPFFEAHSAINIHTQPIPPQFTKAFHASHRSNLLRKDPIHYGQFGWTEPNDLPYVWPV